jgi:hypothetical protein
MVGIVKTKQRVMNVSFLQITLLFILRKKKLVVLSVKW